MSKKIIEAILSSPESYQAALEIQANLGKAQDALWLKFAGTMQKLVNERFPQQIIIKPQKSPQENQCAIIFTLQNLNLALRFEFSSPSFVNPYFGLFKQDNSRATGDSGNFLARMNELFGVGGKVDAAWIWWQRADDMPGKSGLTYNWDSDVQYQLLSDKPCEIHEQVLEKLERWMADINAHKEAWA